MRTRITAGKMIGAWPMTIEKMKPRRIPCSAASRQSWPGAKAPKRPSRRPGQPAIAGEQADGDKARQALRRAGCGGRCRSAAARRRAAGGRGRAAGCHRRQQQRAAGEQHPAMPLKAFFAAAGGGRKRVSSRRSPAMVRTRKEPSVASSRGDRRRPASSRLPASQEPAPSSRVSVNSAGSRR